MSGVVFLVLRLVLVICLYAFLAWAFYTLWIDLRRQSEIITFRKVPALTLTRQDGNGVFHFSRTEVHIGRDPACDCQLEDQTVSTQHAFLSFHHNQWWLEDLGSTNGTFLNQTPVTAPMVITIGDQIRCGQVNLDIFIDGREKGQEQ
jgi:pSer/pThr/pTyr-binding forkhead associated (FHA) protein